MLDIEELQQFVSFAELGTLSKVSEAFHISTPTITRTMQHIEEIFGVPLFQRSKNKIELNETGILAVEYTKNVLQEFDNAIQKINAFDKSLRTIVVDSCAPAPLWHLLPLLSSVFPGITISSNICDIDTITGELESLTCELGIFPYAIQDAPFQMVPFMKEHLFISVKEDHELAEKDEVTFADINGFNFLLRSEIGFWENMCRKKMPSSKFLVQNNDFEFQELVKTSSLPCFVTDYTTEHNILEHDRIRIPITNPEANVTFYLASYHLDKYKMLLS